MTSNNTSEILIAVLILWITIGLFSLIGMWAFAATVILLAAYLIYSFRHEIFHRNVK